MWGFKKGILFNSLNTAVLKLGVWCYQRDYIIKKIGKTQLPVWENNTNVLKDKSDYSILLKSIVYIIESECIYLVQLENIFIVWIPKLWIYTHINTYPFINSLTETSSIYLKINTSYTVNNWAL